MASGEVSSHGARAVALNRTFGSEVTPSAWRDFKDHYSLVKEANIARGVQLWQDSVYRSIELRLCLVGAPADYIREEVAQSSSWVKDDVAIIQRLESRYVNTEAIEVRIIRFEEATQGEDESLADFMTRLQRLAGDAFSSESADIKRKRVVWRFLDGLRDKDIRERLIRESWMKDDSNAKDYDDILKIAETARTAKHAATLTGSRHHNIGELCAAAVQQEAGAAAAAQPIGRGQRWPSQLTPPPVQSRPPPAARSGQPPGRPGAARGRGDRPIGRCYYCDIPHQGGWVQCRRRLRENPAWSPRRAAGVGSAAPVTASQQQTHQDFL